MPDANEERSSADMDLDWLAEYLMRNGAANLCQLMKQQDDPVRWLEKRAAPEFWQRIMDAWTGHQMHSEPGRCGYLIREVSAKAATWRLVDAMLRDARARAPDPTGAAEIDMNALLVQAGIKWFGREKAGEILSASSNGGSPGGDRND